MDRKNCISMLVGILWVGMFSTAWAAQGTNSPYLDTTGDIDPGLATGNGTLDILGMEVSHTASDVLFTLTVNGNLSTTDWGKFLIGIATEKTAGTATGNGWSRPIYLDSPNGAMDYWIGSWVDGGGGAQLWQYTNSAWAELAAPTFSFTPGASSELLFEVPLVTLGLAEGDTFYFDVYASGGGGTDTAIDALANPNVSETSWGEVYTSKTTGDGGNGLNSYKLVESTRVVLYDLYLQEREGAMVVCWETASEEESVGFDLYREENGEWVKVNPERIAAQGEGGMGAAYAVTDEGVNAEDTFRYKLVEYETDGGVQEYGPFEASSIQPRLQTLEAAPEGMVLRWRSRAQDVYEVQRTLDLQKPFESIETGLPATPPVNSFIDQGNHAGSAYYRIRSE